MKKTLIAVLTLCLIAVSFAGCAPKTSTSVQAPAQQAAQINL